MKRGDFIFWSVQVVLFSGIALACYYLWQDDPNNPQTKN